MRASAIASAIAAALVLGAGCFAGSVARQPLPPFALTNQSGHLVRAEELRGRFAVISVVFTGCQEVCPLLMSRLVQAQAEARTAGLTSSVRFVSITLDPATDTPDLLKSYAARFGADTDTWDFLTGEPREVERVVRALGVIAVNDGGRLGHEGPVLLVDARGDIVRQYTGTAELAARIVADVRRLRPSAPAPASRAASTT